MNSPLAANPCLDRCAWRDTGDDRDGLPLFACEGCGSEWVRTEDWTPANRNGRVPGAVRRERDRS
ncbi:hypothetical protein [Mariniluteicoccus flavus]